MNYRINSCSALAFDKNGDRIFAGTYDGVFLSKNNGSSWTAMNTGLTNTWGKIAGCWRGICVCGNRRRSICF